MELDIGKITAIIGWVSLIASMILNILQFRKTKSEARLNDTESLENITESSIKLFDYYKRESLDLRDIVKNLRETCECLTKEKNRLTIQIEAYKVQVENIERQLSEAKIKLEICEEQNKYDNL